jgi:hypothetical protein
MHRLLYCPQCQKLISKTQCQKLRQDKHGNLYNQKLRQDKHGNLYKVKTYHYDKLSKLERAKRKQRKQETTRTIKYGIK